MAHLFQNIETGELFSCGEELWISAFEAAKADGWKPDGTLYDIYYDVGEEIDFIGDDNGKLYTLLLGMMNVYEWDGNYTEKRNQVVTYEDAYYMVMSLKCAGVDPELCRFVGKGSFRICSD